MLEASRILAALAAAALFAGCAAQTEDPNRRILYSHNLLRHAGFGSLGPVSSGEVAPGATQTHQAELHAGVCYVLTAIGGPGLDDVGVTVAGPDGAPVVEDESVGPSAVVSFCAERDGEHQIQVVGARGGGSYHVAYWFGGGGGAGGPGGGGPGGGMTITLGTPVSGTLPPGGRLDYTLQLREGRSVSMDLVSDDFDCYLYVLRDGVEIDRDDDGGGDLNSHISRFLEPGTYTVRVGSFMDSGEGRFTLTVR